MAQSYDLRLKDAVGYDADLTVVDLKRRETITNGWIKSRAGWTL
jgi:dihydroorotase